jgi:peptidoglycan/LPS O-acetylase OafA/YrhL
MRKAGWILAIVFMTALSLGGLYNGTNEFDDATSALQTSVYWGQFLYGFLGLLGAVGIARRRPWSVTVSVAWGIASAYVAAVASFAFHDPTMTQEGTLTGVIAAGVSVLAVSALIVWAARVATRAPDAAPKAPA